MIGAPGDGYIMIGAPGDGYVMISGGGGTGLDQA